MGWAYTSAPDTWIGTTDPTYANQFKWSVIDGVATPNDVVNIQQPGFATAIGIYMNFADAAFNEIYMNGVLTTNGTEYKQDGAGIVVYLSALTAKNTEILIKQSSTTRFGLNIYNDKGSGGGGGDPDPEPDPEPEPDPNSYTAGGHTIHLDASYVDIDGTNKTYTLVISSTDNMDGLAGSFWNVNGVGADMRTNSGTSSYTVSGDKKTITCQVQSSSAPNIYTPLYVLMPGEVVFRNVTLNWEDRTPITSEYCNYQDPQTIKDGKNIALTWETDGSGNVIITMQNGTGASSCSFRNGGFEGGIGAFVVSDDNFVTTTPASDYFTAVQVYSGNTYTLTKKADLPANAKIKHVGSGHALAWILDGNNEYCFPDFIYTYGGTCNQLDAPANVAINANNILTFDAVTGADSYMAYVSLGGVEKYSQAVASGDELTYTALVTGDYIINVVASGAGKVDSDPSADVIWHLEAAPVVLGNSEYCEQVFMAGDNREAAFTWETDGDGNIVITISATRGDAAATHFRGNGMALGNFKVGAGKADASTYFNHACGGSNQVTLSLKNPANAPALGEKIYFNNTVEYATSLDGNAWPTLNFEWTYGTECSGFAVSATPNNNEMGTAVVQKAGADVTNVEDGDEVTFIATVANAEQYRFVNWTKGGDVVSTSATYVTTITETTNLIANFDYIRNIYCHSEINSIQNKKLYMTIGSIGGGQYQIKFEGSAEAQLTGLNNANYTINWVTTDIVDGGKPMSGQDIPFNNARWAFDASGYGTATATFGIAEGHTWEDINVWNHAIYFSTAAGEVGYTDFPSRHNIDWTATCVDPEAPVIAKAEAEVLNESSVRLTIQATDNWGGLLTYTIARADADDIVSNHASGEEFTQDVDGLTAGTEYTFTVTVSDGVHDASQNIVVTPIADNVKPVMSSASLESKTWNSAIISVAATDNKGVTAYYVVEKDAEYVAAEGKITIEGLTAATDYTFHIKAKDAAGNISDNSSEVVFTTDAHSLAPTTAAPVPTWPANQVKSLYSDTYDLAPAHTPNYNAPWWSAPAITLADIDGNHYMDYNLANDGMIGWQYDQISVATMEKLHIDIYASAAGTVSVRPITEGDGALNDNRKSLTLVAQQWNSFDIELTEFGAHDWTKLFQFSIEYWAAGGLLGEHISVDNVYFYRTTALVDNEKPTNVSANVAKASFGSITLNVSGEDNSGTVLYSIKIGDTEYATGAAATATPTTITVNNLTPGTNYNFNVVAYDEAGNAASPVVVEATTKFVPAPIVPDFNAKVVLPVFTDAKACVVSNIHSGGWGETTEVEWLQIAPNDKVFYAQNFNYAGWHSWGGDIDASEMDYLHVDIYSTGMTQVSVTPISHDPTREGNYAVSLTPNAWTSVDIPLSAYAANNIEWNKIFQFKFMGAVGGNELMLDNVYFFRYQAKSNVDGWATFASPVAVKVPEGVTVYKAVYEQDGDDEILRLTPAGDVIPANTGALLRCVSVSTNYPFTLATSDEAEDAVSAFSGNDLVGCAVKTDISAVAATHDIFALRHSDLFGYSGFFLYEGTIVNAGKAYLPLPKDDATPAPSRRVRFVIDATDAATAIDANALEATHVTKFVQDGQLFILRDNVVYTVQGERVK